MRATQVTHLNIRKKCEILASPDTTTKFQLGGPLMRAMTTKNEEFNLKRISKGTRHVTQDQAFAGRHQEAPALQCCHRGFACAPRRPLHREDRLLQSASAARSCRPREARPGIRQDMDQERRNRQRPRASASCRTRRSSAAEAQQPREG